MRHRVDPCITRDMFREGPTKMIGGCVVAEAAVGVPDQTIEARLQEKVGGEVPRIELDREATD